MPLPLRGAGPSRLVAHVVPTEQLVPPSRNFAIPSQNPERAPELHFFILISNILTRSSTNSSHKFYHSATLLSLTISYSISSTQGQINVLSTPRFLAIQGTFSCSTVDTLPQTVSSQDVLWCPLSPQRNFYIN